PPAAPGQLPPEQVLWRGRPYLTIGTRYELTNERIRIIRGILGNNIEEIELVRVKDTKVKQHMGERMLNVGDITIISADPATPEFELRNVRNPVEVRELIRRTMMQEKARRGLYYREDIGGGEPV
ncbi:MAG TPA: PH domain-containing protein, partial [Caldilineaceae bacterium]|nr:PH domain-containing protein [Caldilineaceae bacterium]